MKTKLLSFVVLWCLLVLVQVSVVSIIDVKSMVATTLITGISGMLALYLGLKFEKQWHKREEDDKKQNEIRIFHDALTANEVRAIRGYNPSIQIEPCFSEPDEFFVREPSASAHIVVGSAGVGLSVDPMSRQFHTSSESPIFTLMAKDWGIDADADDTEIEVEPDSDICKHCYRQIKGHVHDEGMNRGKMRCDPEDTLGGYGYNAEASDAECGKTCLGYK